MKRRRFLVTLSVVTLFISGSFASVAYAYDAQVKILDLERNIICDTSFTGSQGMDSIINTAAPCGFTYSLGFGDDFLDDINGIGWDGTNWWALYIDGVMSNVGVNDSSINLNNISEILWVFSDGSYVPPVESVVTTYGGGVIVGLMSASTGGLIDSDGDEISDKDERANGTDPYVQESVYREKKEKERTQMAAAVEAAGWIVILKDIFAQLQIIINSR